MHDKRSWSICINILQKEDSTGYSMKFRPIPQFSHLRGVVPTTMTWTLFATISSCPTLWRIIDTKNSPFVLANGKDGYLQIFKIFVFNLFLVTSESRQSLRILDHCQK